MKDRVSADLQKAKEEERMRAERVQQILKDAFSQTVSEVKQGSGEIRLLAKNTLSSMVETLNENPAQTNEAEVQQTDSAERELKLRTIFNTVKNRLLAYLRQEYATLTNQSVSMKERLSPLQTRLTERYGDRFVELDNKLNERYGDRYATIKQRLETFKAWYGNTLTKAETIGPGLLQQKQAKFESEVVSSAGASVARREQQIKQQIKQFVQTAAAKL